MSDLSRIRALAANRISYQGVVATIGREMTTEERKEYHRTRTAAQLRAIRDRELAQQQQKPEPIGTVLKDLSNKYDLDATLGEL